MTKLTRVIQVGLLGLMFAGTAMAADALAPIGTLQAGAHASIQNELGSFPVSGTYTVLTGDQINIGESESIATLALDTGTLYIHPNSSLTLNESNGVYTVALVSGSMGYELDREGMLKINSSGKEITPVATDGASSAGAVAIGSTGKLVVVPVLGDALAMADDGIVTAITQGYTWTDDGQGAKLTLTQVETDDGLSTDDKVLIGIGIAAGGVFIYQVTKDSNSPSS